MEFKKHPATRCCRRTVSLYVGDLSTEKDMPTHTGVATKTLKNSLECEDEDVFKFQDDTEPLTLTSRGSRPSSSPSRRIDVIVVVQSSIEGIPSSGTSNLRGRHHKDSSQKKSLCSLRLQLQGGQWKLDGLISCSVIKSLVLRKQHGIDDAKWHHKVSPRNAKSHWFERFSFNSTFWCIPFKPVFQLIGISFLIFATHRIYHRLGWVQAVNVATLHGVQGHMLD